jgi:hypothetical protein
MAISPAWRVISPPPLSVIDSCACAEIWPPLMLMPVVLMVMLLEPTFSVIDCPALMVLDPELTVMEWFPVDTVRLSFP